MEQLKIDFLRSGFIPLLKKLAGDEKGKWGVMRGQQMVEHFIDAVRNASGKLILPQINHGERLQKFRDFLMSETPFKENTKNPLLDESGNTLQFADITAAIHQLQRELDYFFETFNNNPSLLTSNPFFGDLNYEQNVQLLHKHAQHHLNQFDLLPAT
jgi:hypothetical protein